MKHLKYLLLDLHIYGSSLNIVKLKKFFEFYYILKPPFIYGTDFNINDYNFKSEY